MAQGVTVDFTAKFDQVKFFGQVDKAMESLDKFRAKAEGIGEKVDRSLSMIGVGLSAAGLTAFVKSGIDAVDALNDLSDRTGIAVEKLAAFEYAAKLGDTSVDAMATSINKLSVNIGKNGDDFKKLGIDAKDPLEAFAQLADVYSNIEDPQKRAALGAAALGRSYAEMAPLLMRGGDGVRALIKDGQDMAGVTAEQARKAGEFNDKLDEMASRSVGFRSQISVGVLDPLVSIGEALERDIAKFGLFEGALRGVIDGYKDFSLSGTGGGLSRELDDINRKIAEQKTKLSDVRRGDIQGGAGREIAENNELNRLLNERIDIEERLSASRKKTNGGTQETPESAAFNRNLEAFILNSNEEEKAAKKSESAANQAAKAEAGRAEAVRKTIENLKFEIDLTGQSADMQKRLTEIRGATVNATAAESAAIEKLIKTKYDLVEADEILAEGERLAAKQRADTASEYERLTQMFSGENQSMYSQFGDAFKAKGAGIIDDKQLAKALENISQGYDAVTGKSKDATDQMSEYAIQAARNMETAFADFLFDPFNEGLDGLAANFAKTLARMAANAASEQIFDGFKSKDSGGGGWGEAIISGISALFHDGGMVGSGGKAIAVNPAVFAGAPRLHNGGYLKPDEVPAILQTGEMVLSRSQVAGMGGGSATKIIVNNYGGSTVETRETNGPSRREIEIIIDKRMDKKMADAKRQGGLYA